MKKIVVLVLLMMLLCGCTEAETLETVSDELVQPVMAQPREIAVSLPGEVSIPTMEGDTGRMYLASDYEIYIQTLASGDLNATVQTVSGYEKDALTVLNTSSDGVQRYDFVWSCAGENGDRIGRGVILDDGNYHYVMTVLRDAETTESTQIVWNDVFDSFQLVSY